MRRTPDFSNLESVLDRKRPARPTLFEFQINWPLAERLTGEKLKPGASYLEEARLNIAGARAAGYDYAMLGVPGFSFPTREHESAASISMNDVGMVHDRESFGDYPWPDPMKADYGAFRAALELLPVGMKAVVGGPFGVLENVMRIAGYEPLCLMLMDDPTLAGDIFDAVGARLLRYYQVVAACPQVGAVMSNDDWGFNSQTMLSPEMMRKYVFPWHKKIVDTVHAAGKPALLHSCGQLDAVMDDIIDVMQYDGKHSYEDKIMPVEEAYEKWRGRIAILGGIDLDFVCRRSPAEVHARAKAMLHRADARGAYALGTGNSVPRYVPQENYLAMVSAATGMVYR